MSNEKSRLTIGVLVSGITEDFSKLICRGVMQMAKQLDVNIVVLPGKYLNRDLSDNTELMYEYQFSTIFSYARPDNVDAVIVVSGSIGCFTTKENVKKLLEQFGDIPCILISDKLDGYISVLYDNYNGIKEGLTYLIEKVGCSKFGLLGGDEDNSDAIERRDTFIKVLEEHGIPFYEKMYVGGNYLKKNSHAYRTLLDNNPGIEAVFCVNDNAAIGFYEELKRRDLQIGKDIHIFGYDDAILSTKVNPTLSSVQADATLLGEEALKMVVRVLCGEKVESKVLATRFVKRDSVGYGTEEDSIRKERIKEASKADVYFHDIFYRSSHEKNIEQLQKIKKAFSKFLNTLVLVYGEGDDSPENIMEIQTAMDDFFNYDAMEYADINNMMNCLENIYHMLKGIQENKEQKYKLQEIFSAIYRRVIRATDYHLGCMLERQDQENYYMKLFVRDVLQFEKGNDLSYTSLLENLEWLDIKNAYIYTFKEPIMHLYREKFEPPEQLYLKAALVDGNVSTVPYLKQKVNIKDIYKRAFTDFSRIGTYVCMPLFFNEMLYGIMLCDLTEGIFVNGEFLINQMSSAAKMITLLKANEQMQQKLEESLLVLKENNLVLDNLSKLDSLTGILNRRGFYSEAEKLLEESREEQKGLLAIYLDMNNLKIINDRYGHEEGDYSLRTISKILSDKVENSGIIGRIGGDEFACLMEYHETDGGDSIIAQIYNSFDEFNKNSDKPYYVTVSAGAHSMSSNDTVSLKEALVQADEKLYAVKKYRKKEVAK